MIEPADCLDLPAKTFDELWRDAMVQQQLDRDRLLERAMDGPEYLAHAAGAEALEQLIPAQLGRRRHRGHRALARPTGLRGNVHKRSVVE